MSQLSFGTRLGYELLWISRMLARREDLFFDAEMRLEEAMLEQFERLSKGNTQAGEGPQIQAEDFRPRRSSVFTNVVPGDDRLFPLHGKTPQYITRLYPGDFLYNPAYWWHEVANIGETIGCALRVVAEGGFAHFLILDKFLLATSFLNPPMLMSNINMTLNHFMNGRRREKLYINDTGPRLTVPIKGRKGPSYIEARRERLQSTP